MPLHATVDRGDLSDIGSDFAGLEASAIVQRIERLRGDVECVSSIDSGDKNGSLDAAGGSVL